MRKNVYPMARQLAVLGQEKVTPSRRCPCAVNPLSRNDLLDVRIDDDDTFNGSSVILRDGMLKLPFLNDIRAQGRFTDQIEADISRAHLADGFNDSAPRISVRASDLASVYVGVSGAVFEARTVEIGGVRGDSVDWRRQDAKGASTGGRNLSAA